MKDYYLFLDESKPNNNFKNFTLGGVVIEKSIYESIVKPRMIEIKKDCFGRDDLILHEIDIRSKKGEFTGLSKDHQEKFFSEMGEFFRGKSFEVLAVTINIDELENLYKADSRNDIYYIALQLLLENFAHFLTVNNGIGSMYLESTDQSNDVKLQNLYYSLLATGTLFLKKEFLQDRLKTINFSIKSDNIIGLQIADFVPNAIARNALKKKEKPFSLLNDIQAILYDGKIGKSDRFGCKEIS